MKPRIPLISPGRALLASFLFAIAIGTLLLSLPRSQAVSIPFIDVLFTSTSMVCVTGLKTTPISSFTTFGKCILLALIQIGGLGLMTLSFFLASLFLNLGMTTQLIAGQILEFQFWNRIKPYLMIMIGITAVSELAGTAFLYYQFKSLPLAEDPLFSAFFHSVSAFCNAGVSLFDNNFTDFAHNPTVMITLMGLMVAGSIGFIVWYDFSRIIRAYFKKSNIGKKLSLHSKIVIFATIALTLLGAGSFWILENYRLLKGLTWGEKLLNSLFTGVSSRGIGYQTLDLSQATLPTLLTFIPLMFIGASPGSTGSGIKTTTFIIFLATVLAIIRNRTAVEIRGRTIANDQIYKVVAITALAIFWIFATTFVLLLTENNFNFVQIFYEAVSALSCCGLTMGITDNFTDVGKCIIIATMLIGRIGSLTLVLALRRPKSKHSYKYPEERVMIG